MPKLTDDPRYFAALRRTLAMQDRELAEFRSRLASRMVGLVGDAMNRMGDVFDEAVLREGLAGLDAAFVDEAMVFVRRSLVQAGEVELVKRIGELGDSVGVDALPEEFRVAFEELARAGLVVQPEVVPSASRSEEIN